MLPERKRVGLDSKAVVPNAEWATESLEGHVEIDGRAPAPEFLNRQVTGVS